jgi:hypothetical protein|tara:strand:- start:4074 stop:4346 length:273 start_codon:yes stop_codon:yes gene_type:complete
MAWHQDFEGIPLEGKHINYSFCFRVDSKDNHVYETICDKESTAKRRYSRFIKKFGEKVQIVSFWKYVWENGIINDEETNLIYHFRKLHEE